MSILQAALKHTLYEASIEYLKSGVSIIPLKGKLCALKSWSMAQQYRASEKVLAQWHQWSMLNGVGIVCGAISGNLVVLDFDSHDAVAEFAEEFPALQNTFIVSSGSRRGAHFYYYVEELPPSTLVKNYELRANGLYVVGVPSPHPSGNLYLVQQSREPMRLHHMHPVVKWIKSKRPTRPAQPQMSGPAAPHTGGRLSREAYFKKRYVEVAVRAQVNALAHATEGWRNTQLYLSAFALGQIVGAGALTRVFVETELMNTARVVGLPENESLRTIKSGIDKGEQRPRQIPPPPRPKQN